MPFNPQSGQQNSHVPCTPSVYYTAQQTPCTPQRWGGDNSNNVERRRGPRPRFNLRTFGKDPSYTIEEFLSTMDDYVTSFEDCEEEAVASVKSYLAGEASALVIDAGARKWAEIREVLRDHYIPPGHEKTHQTALVNMKLYKGETPTSLSIRVRTTMRKAFPSLGRSHRDPMMINAFLQALGDDDIHKTVYAQNIDVFEQVVQLASRMTFAGMASSQRVKSRPSLLHFREQKEGDEYEEGTVARINKIVETRLEEVLHDRSTSRWNGSPNTRSPSRVRSVSSGNSSQTRWDQSRDTRASGNGSNGNSSQTRWDRSRDNRTSGNGGSGNNNQDRRDQPPSPNQRSSRRDYTSGDQRRNPSAGRGAARPRSASQGRTCFKCQGQGHFIADCPSAEWYKRDGTVDEERTRTENPTDPKAPNGGGTPTRPH